MAESQKKPRNPSKKIIEVYERVYNTCLLNGFKPLDEHEPFAPGSALVQCARLTQQKREKILGFLKEGLIVEALDNYNEENPHEILIRSLRVAGVDLTAALRNPTAPEKENEIDDIDISTLSEEEILKLFKDTKREVTHLQNQLDSKDSSLEAQRNIVKELKKENKNLAKKVLSTDEIYYKLSEQFIRPVCLSPVEPVEAKDGEQPLFVGAILSDLHLTEEVKAEEVMGINTYNTDVGAKRLEQFTESLIRFCDGYGKDKVQYQGIVLNIAGDIVSGNIHPELEKTNRTRRMQDRFGQVDTYSASGFDAAFEAAELLIPVIEALRDRFGIVKVPIVVGNHGRNGEKYVYKGHVHDSYDFLAGKLLEKHFARDPKVEIIVSESTDLIYDIYNWRFFLTHGDRMGVKGGDGIIGPIGPIIRGVKKIRDQLANHGIIIDYALLGHFHRSIMDSNIIVNGSLIGPNAYSSDNRFTPEPPQQTMFLVHPEDGIILHHNIVCDHKYKMPRKSPLIPPSPTKPNLKQPFMPRLGHEGPKLANGH
ncbi:MAG: hypothetical protein PHE27_07430 [Alphaproteobacteria bacterium]|nr:hypothetical protein [Alphaproteobacteria bacterium]